ncbi:MAG: amino acid adenylation domain-containing protein [Tildeniella torsiva UHER 1998/13D]|jgi:amino acid adenylation domain-containing protein|nr:amino acid adenylation domain-containing protein [Tildeniella torsiva UHER 1998/13D]
MPKGNVEDFYPLSPIQQGMLIHALDEPEADVYCGQLLCQFSGALDVTAFENAWQQVIQRHAILRTRFVWEGLKEPVQVVQRQGTVRLEVHDWRELPPEAQNYQLKQLRLGDRAQGFTLSQAPLMRLTSIRMADQDYQFLWTYHHLLLDGWSMTVLFQDVAAVYQSWVKGKPLELPPPRPYRDYLVWLQQQDLAAAERFWRQQLQGFTTPTEFRIDERSSDTSAQPHRGKQQVKFSPQLTSNLQRFSRQHQITLNTLIQGAWAILLSRYSGATDLVFGTTSSGRPPELAGVESMLGVFINTLPLRVQVQPDLPLGLWLQQIQRQQVEIRQYEYSPLAKVQQWSDVTAGLPLFESLVLFQNYPVDETLGSELGDLTIGTLQTFEQTHYPLTLIVGLGETLELRLLYDRQRFADETIARLSGHFQTVLDSMERSADQPLAAVAWLTETERQQLLGWSQSQGNYACNSTLHQRFEAQAAQTPDAIAVVHEAQSFTYCSLNQRANQLAHALQQRGVQPDRLVGLCVERSLDLLVGVLGILKAGGAYVPLDPAAPPERLAFMIADSQLEVVVTQTHLTHALTTPGQDLSGQAGVQLLCLDTDWDAIAQFPSTNPLSPTTPDHPAYVIYTSGSTGLPKGVLVTHGNVTRLFTATDEWFQFCDRDRWALFHSFAFDFSVWEIWGALLYGGRLLIVPYCLSRDPQAFHQWVCQEGVTVLNQTPSAFWQFMQADAASAHTAALSLRYVIFGGEALDLASLKPWCDRYGDGQGLVQRDQRSPRLINMYGITETTVHVTYCPITQADIEAAAGSLIGRAIPDLQLYVLDPQRQLVPIGVPGELYVGGAGVAQGYVNRPDLTAERFIPNPFGVGRLYRTGDRVRYCSNGDLAYLGRLDHQVKLRGFRIELGEIEAVLRQHPALCEASVLVREDRPGDQRLVAYVVPRETHDHLATALKTCLRAQLPDYMVPSAFVMLKALPLTLNGKLDRSALPAPPVAQRSTDGPVPQTSVEKTLVEIWSTVLGLEAIGTDDNFFDIGGHSLLAAQAVTRIRDQFQVKLSMRDLFEAPTIAALATVLGSRLQTSSAPALPPIQPLPRTGQSFPVSFAQRRLWVLDQLDPGRAFYTIPAAVRLRGKLDLAALSASFRHLVQRHETLRTTFAQVEGQPVQVIAPVLDLPLTVVDLGDRSDREAQVTALCLSEAQRPFDLEQGPLLRVTVLKLAETEHIVLLTMHHIVSDGWSMGVLIQELASLYSAFVHHQVPTLPALPVQYADFAAWQQQTADDWLPHQLTYWLRQLQGAPSFLPLPTDYPRPAVQSFRGAQRPFQLTAKLSQALHELGRQGSATLFMTLLAGFNVLLHHLTQAEDILVGSPIANRNRAELEGLIGFFVNTLVLRSQPSGAISFRTLLHQVRETTLAAYAHPDAPFERLVDELKLKRTLSHNPLFQVWFVLQNAPAPDLELPGLTLSPVDVEQTTARYDLKLNLWESSAGIAGFWNYNADLFAATTIHHLSDTWVALLERLAQSPDLPLQNVLSQLAERDRQQPQAQVQGLQSAGRQRLKQTRRKPLRG